MPGNRPRICAVVVNDDLKAVKAVEPLVDLFEVRIDLIGDGWQELVKSLTKPWPACNRSSKEGGNWQGLSKNLTKPWLACNRSSKEGGSWQNGEAERIAELLRAVELGASIVDIELSTPAVAAVVKQIKGRAVCLLSYHNLKETPPLEKMREIVREQLAAGADICKLITTARNFTDNVATLRLITDFPQTRVVSFAMGALGHTSRVLCPLVGGDFTYASIEEGRESAPGQMTVRDLRNIYGMLQDGK